MSEAEGDQRNAPYFRFSSQGNDLIASNHASMNSQAFESGLLGN